ncbi:MAG: hypothetical protein ABSD62_06090 [Candidatus Limnocylindrales bacterium]|jgi:hypothetical protein
MASESPSSLAELWPLAGGSRPWLVDLVQAEVGGGRISRVGLEAIDKRPDATGLNVSGLDQAAFETLITTYGGQFSGIYFWKCPRIEDLGPLEDLPNLRHVGFFWNQRTSRLWDLSRNPLLRGIRFEDFTRLHDLEDLRRASSIEELRFGSAVWTKSVIASLSPLESLPQLRSLSFDAKTIEDGRIQPLAELQQLQSLRFPSNQFTTRQVAWLRARLPDPLQSTSLEPIWGFKEPIGEGEYPRDTLVVGKRKPWLNSTRDAEKIERYVDEFWKMVEEFRQYPERQPD